MSFVFPFLLGLRGEKRGSYEENIYIRSSVIRRHSSEVLIRLRALYATTKLLFDFRDEIADCFSLLISLYSLSIYSVSHQLFQDRERAAKARTKKKRLNLQRRTICKDSHTNITPALHIPLSSYRGPNALQPVDAGFEDEVDFDFKAFDLSFCVEQSVSGLVGEGED